MIDEISVGSHDGSDDEAKGKRNNRGQRFYFVDSFENVEWQN